MKKCCLSLFLLICLLLTGCTAKNSNRYLISDTEGSEEYAKILNTYLDGYNFKEPKDTLYAEVSKGNAVACFDVQAIPAIERGCGRYWYPHILGTMVLAVDRTRTDEVITGWNSLRKIQAPVGMKSNSVIRNMMAMGAVTYGLNREVPSKQDTLDLLEYLYQSGRFELNNSDAPILLCMDYEAVEWNRKGEHYEIIVPVEGTLSYRMGLLSDVPLTLEPGLDKALLSAGLPLANGDRPQDYPNNYWSAHTLNEDDYNWFFNVTGDSSRDLRRQVFHTRLYTTADLREHILFVIVIIIIVLLWKETVFHRMSRRNVRWIVGIMIFLIVGWLLLRLFKYQLISEGILSRICWYGYYVFQLALPVVFLYLTMIIDKTEEKLRFRGPFWLPFAVYVMSVLLVMTNDLHQFVFFFDLHGNWSNNYHYGIGYWIITAISLLFIVFAIGKLLIKGWQNSYWIGKIFLLLFCIIMFIYIFAYINRVPWAWESDLTVCICMVSVLFFEALLHTGLIPVNVQYHRLFTSAPISMALLDENGNTVLSSRGAVPVSSSIWKRLLADMEHPLLRDNDTQLYAVPIHGGMAIWQENLSELNRIRQEIQDVQIRLEAANVLLQEEGEVKKRRISEEINRKLFEHLDRDMKHRIAALVHLIETLPKTDYPKDVIAYITLCLCHIKRRCNIFFLARQGKLLCEDELNIYLDELTELARYAGLQMLIRCGQSGALEIQRASLCYDFAFETISWALRADASPLMGYLEQEGDHLVFRFLPGSDPGQWHFPEELRTALAELGGQIVCKDLDDAIGIYMTLPLGGETDG